jgi:hypothetical protein
MCIVIEMFPLAISCAEFNHKQQFTSILPLEHLQPTLAFTMRLGSDN